MLICGLAMLGWRADHSGTAPSKRGKPIEANSDVDNFRTARVT